MSSTWFISNPITMSESQPESIWSRCRTIPLLYHQPTSQAQAKALVMMSSVFTTALRLEHPRSLFLDPALW